MTKRLLLGVAASASFAIGVLHAQNAPVTAFIGATIVDGTGAAAVPNGVVLVRDGRITAAGPADRVTVPANARRIDLAGKTIMPGFINVHGHMAGSGRDRYVAQLRLYARYGVTSVFSLGGEAADSVPVRDEPARGRARLFIAGPVVAGTTTAAVSAEVSKNAAMKVDWLKIRIDGGATRTQPMSAYGTHAVGNAQC
jgi:imidazolonepropionase-like amidohydrolase